MVFCGMVRIGLRIGSVVLVFLMYTHLNLVMPEIASARVVFGKRLCRVKEFISDPVSIAPPRDVAPPAEKEDL